MKADLLRRHYCIFNRSRFKWRNVTRRQQTVLPILIINKLIKTFIFQIDFSWRFLSLSFFFGLKLNFYTQSFRKNTSHRNGVMVSVCAAVNSAIASRWHTMYFMCTFTQCLQSKRTSTVVYCHNIAIELNDTQLE